MLEGVVKTISADSSTTRQDNTLSIGGGARYADLLFQKDGNSLVVKVAAQLLSGSDTAAFGGDLAYRYGRSGSLADISLTPALAVFHHSSFGTAAHTLQSLGSLQDTSVRLS